MPRKRTQGLTDREAEIMSILWDISDASVEDIRERLSDTPSASTVRTLLAIMVDRGLVAHDGAEYAKRYRTRLDRSEAQWPALRRLIDRLYAGSTEALLVHLVDQGEVDLEQLKRLQARLRREGSKFRRKGP